MCALSDLSASFGGPPCGWTSTYTGTMVKILNCFRLLVLNILTQDYFRVSESTKRPHWRRWRYQCKALWVWWCLASVLNTNWDGIHSWCRSLQLQTKDNPKVGQTSTDYLCVGQGPVWGLSENKGPMLRCYSLVQSHILWMSCSHGPCLWLSMRPTLL
jgi:hypothetical protein